MRAINQIKKNRKMVIWFRNWSYSYMGVPVVLRYQMTVLLKTRLLLFLNGQLLASTPWQFSLNKTTLSVNFLFDGKGHTIDATVNHNQPGHEVVINGLLISDTNKHPSNSAEYFPKKSWSWYMFFKAIPMGLMFGAITYLREPELKNFGLSFLLFGFSMGNFFYFMSRYVHIKKKAD